MWSPFAALGALLLLLLMPGVSGAAEKASIVGIDHRVPSVSAYDHRPITLALWEKRLRRVPVRTLAQRRRIVLLAHGATIPGRPDFDLQRPPDRSGLTYSLMDHLAGRGYDVFAVDYQNYGGSDHHPCGLCVTTQVAADDLLAAVDYIRRLRGVDRIHLLGCSWGASTAGLLAQQHPDRVLRLIQYAPYLRQRNPDLSAPTAEFRPLDVEQCCRSDFVAAHTDPGVFEAFAQAALHWQRQAPNGVLHDFATRMPLLDPRRIRVPTLVIFGALDATCPPDQPELPGYFRELATDDKQLTIIPEGGHALLLMQSRDRFHRAVDAWLSLAPSR